MKNPFWLAYGFKLHHKYINERLSKLVYCLQSRPNNQIKIFSPFGNEFLPPSRNITFKCFPIIYPLKHKYLCDYNTRCLMPSGFMLDDIIINTLRNKKLECHDEEDDCFLQILITK